MADLSLREYTAKLENLLSTGNATEVILHARHILQYYPRNVQTYRALGRALVETRRYPEAAEVLRRVLSVYPDDVDAHRGLSEVYLNDKRTDEAIWHLERAFEQDPNNKATLDNIRELYRRYRKVEQGKIQLTTGAVARQYLRNGLFAQAIEALQETLSKNQQRPDLRLLLAQTYLDGGQLIEAGETATEVLKDLPDCLRANAILAVLWLTQERPSDAQQHINRIESVDPYLALELAQGQAPDDIFKLPELDYRREAEREMTIQSPDWLDNVGAGSATVTAESTSGEVEPESPDWLADAAIPDLSPTRTTGPLPPPMTGPFDTSRKKLSGLLRRTTGQLEDNQVDREPAPDFFDNLPAEPVNTSEPITYSPPPISTAELFDDLPAEPITSSTTSPAPISTAAFFADLPDVESGSASDVIPAAAGAETDNDPLAWLRGSGVEVTDTPRRQTDTDLFDTADDKVVLQDAEQSDPLAWMQNYGDDMLAEADQPEGQVAAEEDPLAWLKESNAETVEPPVEDLQVATPSGEDSLNWLQDESLLDEAFKLEALVDNQPTPAAMPERQDNMADELDWMSEADDEPALPTNEDFPDWLSESAAEAVSADDTMNWMSELPSTKMLTEQPSQTIVLGEDATPGEEPPQPTSKLLGRLSTGELPPPSAMANLEPTMDDSGFEWLSQGEEEPYAESEPGAADAPDWLAAATPVEAEMSEFVSENLEPEVNPVDAPDWLAAVTPVEAEMSEFVSENLEPEANPADVPDWLAAATPVEDQGVEPTSESPEWLSQMETPAPDAAPVTGLIGRFKTGGLPPMMAMEGNPESETPEWLKEMQPPDEEETPATFDPPDWIADVPEEEQPITDVVPEPAFDWLPASDEQALPEAELDTPPELEIQSADAGFDWLAGAAPETATIPDPSSADEAVGASEFEWLSQNEPEVQPETSAVPDWLAQSQTFGQEETTEPEPSAQTTPWLQDEAVELEMSAEAQLSDAEIQAALERGDLVPSDQMEAWMSRQLEIGAQRSDDFAEFEEEAPVTAADVPDWLMSAVPAEPAETPTVTDADGLTALLDSQPAIASDEPDWLTQMQPEEDIGAQPVPTDEFGWSSDEQPAETALTEEPEWLTAMQAASSPQPVQDTLEDHQTDEPDWLSEIQPGMETEPAMETGGEGFDWNVNNDVVARVTNDLPDWVTGTQAEEMAVPELEPSIENELAEAPMADIEDLVDEMSGQALPDDFQIPITAEPIDQYPHEWAASDMPDEQPVAPAAASNAPDWLNAMVPGLDVDYSAAEDEPIETEFMPGSENRAALVFQSPGASSRQPSEFNWLMDIVEHESQQVEPVSEGSRQPRFVFTREPAWLRQPTEQRDTLTGETDDIDLPPWLR